MTGKKSSGAYEAPALIVLGPAQDLTKGGRTGSINDSPFPHPKSG